MTARALTVGELINCLRVFSEDTPVVAVYDNRCAEGAVVALEVGSAQPHPGPPHEAVILVVD